MFNSALKTLAVASVIAFTGVAASAEDHIFIKGTQNIATHVTVDLVRASGPGSLNFYDFHKGEQGAFLGSVPVKEGANTNVKVNFTQSAIDDVIAILVLDDGSTPVAMKEIENSMNE